jgi:hypothetical protein
VDGWYFLSEGTGRRRTDNGTRSVDVIATLSGCKAVFFLCLATHSLLVRAKEGPARSCFEFR